MNILETIIARKRIEVEQNLRETPVAELERSAFFHRETLSLKNFLLDKERTGIIAEFKRRSPSKGPINEKADLLAVTGDYAKYGASAISILTDEDFFGGSTDDLRKAWIHEIPLLRKDFIIDEYQVLEARAMGADIILLIASCLRPSEVKQLAALARQLKMDVLLELHDENELDHICDDTEFIGVNNRNLKTFSVDLERSIELGSTIPAGKIRIAESGISDRATLELLKSNGFDGFLIGERFMKETDPGEAFRLFTQKNTNNEY